MGAFGGFPATLEALTVLHENPDWLAGSEY